MLGRFRTGTSGYIERRSGSLRLALSGVWHLQEEEEPEVPASAGRGYAASQPVRLKGLVQRPDLNGREAVLKDFDQEAGRWELELDGEKIRCKPECLEALEKKEVRWKSSLSL